MKLFVNSTCTYVVLAACIQCAPLISFAQAVNQSPAKQTVGPVALSNLGVKSYREWKTSMVTDAQTRIKITKEAIIKKARIQSFNDEVKSLHNRLDTEVLQLSMAHDMSISDYFVGYLTKQKDLDKAIKDVSSRLTPDEVAELMSAYANNFFSGRNGKSKATPQAHSDTLSSH